MQCMMWVDRYQSGTHLWHQPVKAGDLNDVGRGEEEGNSEWQGKGNEVCSECLLTIQLWQ